MSANPSPLTRRAATSLPLGATLVTLAGLGFMGYGFTLLIRNFTGFIELGLTPEHVGATPDQIHAFSPQLFGYISHLHAGLGGLIVALGVAVVGLGWHGVRRGERWALWTAFLAPVTGLALAVPMHYVYGIATLGHLGPVYMAAAILLSGCFLAWRARGAARGGIAA